MLSGIYQYGRGTKSCEWSALPPSDRRLFPGFDPQVAIENRQASSWLWVGRLAKLLVPSAILIGSGSSPLVGMSSLTAFSLAAIYSDIKLQGKLRTFELGSGLALPLFLPSFYRTLSHLPSGDLLASLGYGLNCCLAGHSIRLFWTAFSKRYEIQKEKDEESKEGLAEIIEVAQVFLPFFAFMGYRYLPTSLLLLLSGGGSAASLWLCEKQFEGDLAKDDTRALIAGIALAVAIPVGGRTLGWS